MAIERGGVWFVAMTNFEGVVYEETSDESCVFFFEGKWRLWLEPKNMNSVVDVELDLVTVIVTVAL